jgi:hypothetical protein
MNEKISIGAFVILVIGAALAWGIINMDNIKFWKNRVSQYQEDESTDQRGKHCGWLFT